MAVDDRYSLQIQGVYCGALFQIGAAYVQTQPDLEDATPGESLVEGWFVPTECPFKAIRPLWSTELSITCATWSSPKDKGTAFISPPNNVGLNEGDPLPSTVALMLEIWAQAPWPKNFAGRQFIPGFVQDQVDGSLWVDTIRTDMADYIDNLKNITPTGAGGVMFKLLPEIGMQENPIVLGGGSILAQDLFVDPFVRRIKSRMPDQCAIAAAQGAPAGSESFDPGAPA